MLHCSIDVNQLDRKVGHRPQIQTARQMMPLWASAIVHNEWLLNDILATDGKIQSADGANTMAKDPTYHTTSREYPEAMREVHHDGHAPRRDRLIDRA